MAPSVIQGLVNAMIRLRAIYLQVSVISSSHWWHVKNSSVISITDEDFIDVITLLSHVRNYTLWTEKTHQNVFVISSTNPVDSHKIWHTLSWINLQYSSLNAFQLTWVMLLHYTLWNLAFAFCKWRATGTVNPKTHQMFLSHRLRNEADSDNISYLLSWIYLPQS